MVSGRAMPSCGQRGRRPPGSSMVWLRMNDFEAEFTADLIRGLLRDLHPDLAGLPLYEVESGRDNQMWRLRGELAVRAQRMDTVPDHQLKERRWLPLPVPRLPLDRGSISRGEHVADTLAAFPVSRSRYVIARAGGRRRTGGRR